MKALVICLWFDSEAEEAAGFYTSVFEDAEILGVHRYLEAGQELHGKPVGSVMTVDFRIGRQHFMALNGGPLFKFNEAVSLQVMCESQEEVDHYWEGCVMKSEKEKLAFGMLGGAFGLAVGMMAIVLGLGFAFTGYSLLGIAGAYYGIGGLLIGSILLALSLAARRNASRYRDESH
jgi:predicted 3-demethylubiquinone-9 3-methyltransferase (glyoxalase superfamily)